MAQKQSKPAVTTASINEQNKGDMTKRFLEHFESGAGTWQKGCVGSAPGRPVNMLTGVEYSGSNAIFLGPLSRFQSNRYVTYKQLEQIAEKMAKEGVAKADLPHVRKGETGTVAYKYTPFIKAKSNDADPDAKDEVGMSISRFTVFNAEQIENCPPQAVGMTRPFEPVLAAEQMLEALKAHSGLKILHDEGNFYSPSRHEIHLFPKEQFKSELEYYSTAGHEGIHSSLSPNCMDRRDALGKKFGDQAYAQEELRAGFGEMLICMDLGLPISDNYVKNQASYAATWAKAMRDDPTCLTRAMGDAEKIVDWIKAKTHEYCAERGIECLLPKPRAPREPEAQSTLVPEVAKQEATAATPATPAPAEKVRRVRAEPSLSL